MKKMDFIFARAFLAGKVQKVQKCIGFNKKDFLGNVFSMTFEELCNSCTTRTKFYCLFLASYGSGFATFSCLICAPSFLSSRSTRGAGLPLSARAPSPPWPRPFSASCPRARKRTTSNSGGCTASSRTKSKTIRKGNRG
jgi:hypothetical protein